MTSTSPLSLVILSALACGSASGLPKAKPRPVVTREDKSPPPTLAKGTEITVEDYDAKTDTFALQINTAAGVGPNFVTPDNLRRGIDYPGDQEAFMRQKSQMIGSIYQLKNPTPLVSELEMERREKRPAP